jgi:hypothetical protein
VRPQANRLHEEQVTRAILASPIGQATTAKEQGQGFFEIQLKVGPPSGRPSFSGLPTRTNPETKTLTHAGTLAAIEAVGWRLEHVGYVFVVAEESSRRKLLKEQTAVSGETIGIYLFRNID